jgi:hypothetical protein
MGSAKSSHEEGGDRETARSGHRSDVFCPSRLRISASVGKVEQIVEWRARRAAKADVPIGSPPFVLEEPCAGCGARRVSTMVWRDTACSGQRLPFPRVEPHFLCSDGRVVWQEITDAPIPIAGWSRILGHFEESKAE